LAQTKEVTKHLTIKCYTFDSYGHSIRNSKIYENNKMRCRPNG